MVVFTSCAISLLAFLFCSPFAKGDIDIAHNDIFATQPLLQDRIGENVFASYRSVLVNQLNQSTLQTDGSLNISPQCLMDLTNIKNNSDELSKYIDAAGKLRSGIARGNLLWLGSYSGCLALSDGKYCVSTIEMAYPTYNISIGKIVWGACFPKGCSEIDIYFLMQIYILPTVQKDTGIQIKYPGSLCPKGPTYSTGVKVTIAFFGVLLLFCVIGTLIDMVMEELKQMRAAKEQPHTNGAMTEHTDDCAQTQHVVENIALNSDNHPLLTDHQTPRFSTPLFTSHCIHSALFLILKIFRDFLLCFSLLRNSQKIFNTNVPATAITCINGIRVISISWVILGHVFLLFLFSPFTDNKVGLSEDSQLFSIMPVINGYYSVDSFFFLSGLLVAYTCFRKLEKSGGICKFNWFLFYFHRFWRLTPTYMAVILISVQLKRFLASGPLWYSQYEDKVCEDHWWTNLLYINNFYPGDLGKECLGVGWYLANDMQFFVITPPLLILMYKFRWSGVIGPGSLIAASTAAIAFIIGYWDLDPFISLRLGEKQLTPKQQKQSDEYGKYVYIKPWCRAQPYLVGFVLGYYIYKSSQQYYNRRRRPAVFWLVTVIGWAVAAALGMWLVYGPHKYIVKGADEWPLAGRVAYGMFERLLWGLVLAWVTYACHFGGGGLVQKFLSAKFWIPLSRLTFNVYLIHIIVITVMMIGAQGNIHYDFFNISYYYVAAIVLSYVAAYILAVTIEFPLDNLENMALKLIKETPRIIYSPKLSIRKPGSSSVEINSDLISTDDDPGLRIESFGE